jgi:thiamine-phosphate pyrophosphorylase
MFEALYRVWASWIQSWPLTPFAVMLPLPRPANKLGKPVICYVTDGLALGAGDPNAIRDALVSVVRKAAAAGVNWVQLREKHLSAREMTSLARKTIAIAAAAGATTRVIINDRLDVAIAAGAAGIHLGWESVPVEDVIAWREEVHCTNSPKVDSPPRIAADFLIGKSCHHFGEIRQAEIAGADYVFFGPVFTTPSKERYGSPQGLQKLAEACRSTYLPVMAIGGITDENASECLRAGAAGIAAIRLFQQHPTNLRELLLHLRDLT